VFFYDLTSTYFEGKAEGNPKAKRGYSRDKRPDCKQVVLGLAVNRDGFPVFHEVSEGNTQDRATLGPMLVSMDVRIGLREGQTVIVDRGMAYEENLKTLREHPKHLHYIVAMRQSERDKWLADFEEEEGFEEVFHIPSPRNPYQKKSSIRVKYEPRDGYTYVLCHSEERVEKDRAIRRNNEVLFLIDVDKLAKRITARRLVKSVKMERPSGVSGNGIRASRNITAWNITILTEHSNAMPMR
jgi:transposase